MDKPKLKRDWKGRYVRLLNDLFTRGGTTYKKGTVMRVTHSYGGLHLIREWDCPLCGNNERFINKVREREVELLPEDYVPEPLPRVLKLTPELTDILKRMVPHLDMRDKGILMGVIPEIRSEFEL